MNLDEAAVRRLLRMDDLLPLMEQALAAFSAGSVTQPLRRVIPVAEQDAALYVMPARAGGALGVKLVTLFPHNQQMPTHLATVLLFRPETGELLATLDGRLITEMRTAAVSAVATNLLARRDAGVLALLGSGVQAHSHLEALRLVRPFRTVRVWSPHSARAFARKHAIDLAASAEACVRDADVIVTATTSATPVLHGDWLAPGTHINAIGAPRPDWRELDDGVVQRARVFVDSREAALAESGDMRAGAVIAAELGEVVAGTATGRSSDREITLFKSLGMAVEDIVTADLVVRRALEAVV